MDDFEDNNPFAGSDRTSSIDTFSNDDPQENENRPDEDVTGIEESYASTSARRQSTPRAYTSKVEQVLSEDPEAAIAIIDAGKMHEGNSRGFIAYTIRIGNITVRRRYSEFESLRNTLTRLFPTLIVPPIPEKHSMSDYAAAPTKAKEDSSIIEHRQRMLAVFLNRCRAMPDLRHSTVFQRFLDPNSSWSEVLNAPPVSDLPKNILRAPPLHPETAQPGHAFLPIPSSSSKLQTEEEDAFDEVETSAREYEHIIVGGLEKINRRIIKRYVDMAADYSELGARFNAFSLEEADGPAAAIEKVGQAVDASYMSTEELVALLSKNFSEPLGESAQFAAVVRHVLKYRRQKALQLELTTETLKLKKHTLESLERSEREAQRMNSYLSRDVGGSTISPQSPEAAGPQTAGGHIDNAPTDGEEFPPTHAATEVSKKRGSVGGFRIPGMDKLSHALHGMIDVDPEATRRSNISKVREQIHQLEEALRVSKTDAVDASSSVKTDLERFQNDKERDLQRMMREYVRCHLNWAKKNLESWQEAKVEIDRL